jgi:hypothetical protein
MPALPPPLPRTDVAKTVAAWTALVVALSGAIELRVKVGTISDRVDRIEKRLERIDLVQYASTSD